MIPATTSTFVKDMREADAFLASLLQTREVIRLRGVIAIALMLKALDPQVFSACCQAIKLSVNAIDGTLASQIEDTCKALTGEDSVQVFLAPIKDPVTLNAILAVPTPAEPEPCDNCGEVHE